MFGKMWISLNQFQFQFLFAGISRRTSKTRSKWCTHGDVTDVTSQIERKTITIILNKNDDNNRMICTRGWVLIWRKDSVMTNNSSYLLIQLVIKNGPNLASCQSLQVNSKWGCIRETVFTKQVRISWNNCLISYILPS